MSIEPHDPALPPEPPSAWLFTPADIRAVLADDALRDRLARGERPDEDDPDPAARLLARWLLEFETGGTR